MITALTIFAIWFAWTISFTIVTVWLLKVDDPTSDVTVEDLFEAWFEDMGGPVVIAYFLHPLAYLYPVFKWIVATVNATIGKKDDEV